MSVRYCGRPFSHNEIEWLRTLIGEDPDRTRAELSRLACREFNWLKADGGLKAMSARVAMLRMQDDGLIELPPPRCKRPDARVHITRRTDLGEAIDQPAHALAPLSWRQVQKKAESRLWVDICSCNIDINHIPVAQTNRSSAITTSATKHFQVRNCAILSTPQSSPSPCSVLAPPHGKPHHEISTSAGVTNSANGIFT